MKKIFICVLSLLLFSCEKNHGFLGVEIARQELKKALSEETKKPAFSGNLISDRGTAIAIAEPVLFKIYGKEEIVGERPYEVYLINGYWVLMGTMPERMMGGTFLIILSAKDGHVIKITHGK